MMLLSPVQVAQFQNVVWDFYAQHKRDFPWRHIADPYQVMVSEIMLQQTTTQRVLLKFAPFITQFPSITALGQAPLHDVLTTWQGLGYNRRAKYLHESALHITKQCNGVIPNNPALLSALPGIGKATASSICAFAFQTPATFIETNIRTVFIHSFFKNTEKKVSDALLEPLVTQCVDKNNPREWYYALMDYGVHIKKTVPNPNRQSCHYTRQSRFEGSDRQIRGAIIRTLTHTNSLSLALLLGTIPYNTERINKILQQLIAEKLVKISGDIISIF